MTRRSAEWLAALLLCAAWAPAVGAQDDWPHWGRDAGNQRHSPLTQIDTNNVSTLVPAWRYEMRKEGRSVRHAQSTPLVVGGVLYLSFPFYHVVALEPETGELIWEYTAPGDWNSPEHQLHYNGLGSMRGLAYWKGDGVTPPQIVFATEEGDLISLDAATGIPNPRFGIGGFVDLRTPEVMRGFSDMTHYGISSGVAIYKHLVYTGAHIVDETGSKGPAGDTRAWDLRTGDLVWTFHTVPQPGEVGHETWHDDSWRNATGANNWSFFGIDEERGILYMPLGSANNDFYGVDRPGDNLFANSIVAVDAETGALKWYFQAVHHDLWDYDMPVPPMLFDVERDGETIPAVGVMTKFPLLFIFDRVTGESIYEIEERPVPAGSIPGEYYSPTQPFPVKPPPLGRISFTMDDIATITPAHEAACRSLMIRRFDGYHPGPFTPPSPGGALMLPSKAGGAEFTGGTFDPSLGYYIINTADTGQIVRIVEADDIGPPESPRLYRHVPRWGRVGSWPCWQPPWSRLTAVDVDTGEIAWQIPFGTVGGALAGVETGAPDSQKGGPTSTAGGVFFIGGATDRRFRAYETRTGRELWSVETEELINGANPITYMGSDGKQYVAVVAGTKLLTFTLPPNRSPVSVDGLPALVLSLSDDAAAVDVDVSVAFRDPDGDALAYEASSSSASVATVSVSGSTLTVTPVSAGAATVTVTATDVDGSNTSASQSFTVTVPPAGIDYDADGNGLLEVETLAQLDAVRYDLDGDGVATEAGAAAYEAAFPDARRGRGCAGGGCRGYELVADLDLDTNGNGIADAGDAYWHGGAGWMPIGGQGEGFAATFAGNGHVIRGLFVDRAAAVGLFATTSASSVIHGVGLVGVDVRGETQVGGLVGVNRGTVRWSYATGAASGSVAGGLVGENHGTVAASYSTAVVTGGDEAGGLVGSARSGSVVATYATGRVSGTQGVGGLVGSLSGGALTGSYATGRVTGTSDVGGLVGSLSGGTLTSSYWDTETTGHETGSAGRGLPTSALQASDWYSTDDLGSWWNLDVDGDGGGDLPWLFGGTAGYLALWPRNAGWSDWVEFGHQVRSGPSVTATVDSDGVAVSWTAVDVSHWRPAPPVTYAVYRTSAAGVERVATGLTERTYADTALSAGTTYAYQVAAEVWGGEPARSRRTEASAATTPLPVNDSPVSAGSLAALTLAVADGAATVEVGGAFSDPDGDALTFGAASSAPAVATVTVSGSTVTVTPVSAGASTVTVTATDVDGSNTSASQSFTVTVPNRSPVSAGSLAALTLAVADGAATVEVGGAFSDPDGDALTFGAASSAPAVATVTVSGSTVTVTPVSAGASTVTVTATDVDGSNTSASQSFTVTVPNRSPVSAGSLAALTLAVADGAATVEVGGAFSDPDGDALRFGAASSAPAVATVTVSGSTVTVTPVSAGASTVTVTATDVDGSNTSASQSFTVTVPNRSPVSAGSLAALTLAVADGAATVEVGGAFSDPDGDALTFGAASSAPAVATVTVSGSTVTVTPVSAGAATVTVTATDVDGSNTSASQSFTVTVPATDVDYDADDDGLIEIRSLAQLDAVRHDLDGDGVATRRGATTYGAAFSEAAAEMGCPATGCTGYELTADLGFDTNGNGTADAGDAWWNRGSGWVPLGSASSPFTSTFWGNGHTVSHLFIRDAARDHVGLFGMSRGVVGGVGLVEVDVSGRSFVGGLVGKNEGGRVTASHTTGRVSGYSVVGGLVGWNAREIREHESGQPNHVSGTGVVTASYSTAQVSADFRVGGLVGLNWDRIAASYATGSVTAQITQAPWLESSAGGLVGMGWYGSVAASYATGGVSGPGRNVGGLTGNGPDDNEVTASYWDTESSGVSSGGAGSGRPTSALQEPMGYTGLYASWAVDVDGDGEADRPWDFGTSTDYPVLSLDVNGDGVATWREVGGQGRTETAAPASSSASSAGVATTRGVPRPAFTDDPLVAGTPVRAVQLLELRSRIDGLRRGLGLLGFSWTDATIVRGVTPARAVHLTDLRTALDAAYAAAGREAPVYTDAVVTAGVTALRAVHLQELRAAVAALEQRRSPTAGRTGENPAAGPPVRSVVPSI